MPEISTRAAATPKAAPTVKRRFESSLARLAVFSSLGVAARACESERAAEKQRE